MFLSRFFSFFTSSRPQKSDFSIFFRETPPEKQKKVLEEVVRKANEDQKKVVEQNRKLQPKTTH